jgi:hypothetical protein
MGVSLLELRTGSNALSLFEIIEIFYFYCSVGYGACSFKNLRDVAQPGSALRSGRRGRWFESSHPDFARQSCLSEGGLFIAPFVISKLSAGLRQGDAQLKILTLYVVSLCT